MQPDPFSEEDLGFTVNLLRSTIQKYFIVNDVRFDREAFAFFIQLDPRTLEQDFDDLRRELIDLGFIPMILKERPGYIIYVTRVPERRFRGITVNWIMLVATIISTIFAGMLFVVAYDDIPFWSAEAAGKGALYFAAPLMFILGIHEMGHYLMARRHRIAASLPFFIPAPTILGTFGAFISVREPIHSKRALMDIGIAGPIAGFVVAIFITILGFLLSAWDPHYTGDDASEYLILGTPLIFNAIAYMVPLPENVLIHPTTFAGWVGFLVTSLNLLPAGQLDGGHITRALFGGYAKYVGFATVAAMVGVSIAFSYWGWIVFILFILLVMNHPPPLNDISPLPPNRIMLGAVAFIMLTICFVPAPFTTADLDPRVDVDFEVPEVNVALDGAVNNTMVIHNTGNTRLEVRLRLQSDHGWKVAFDERLSFPDGLRDWSAPLLVPKDRSTNFTTTLNMTVQPSNGSVVGNKVDFTVEVKYHNVGKERPILTPHFRAVVGWVEPREVPDGAFLQVGTVGSYDVRFKNLVTNVTTGDTTFDLDLHVTGGLAYSLTNASVTNMTPQQVEAFPPVPNVTLPNDGTVQLRVWVFAPQGTAEPSEHEVTLEVTPQAEPGTTTTIAFQLEVGTITYAVSVTPSFPSWNFTIGEDKNVTFKVDSYSNVEVEVDIAFDLGASDAFEFVAPPLANMTLAAGERGVLLTVRLFAAGDVDDEATLEVRLSYGVSQSSSAETLLRISTVA